MKADKKVGVLPARSPAQGRRQSPRGCADRNCFPVTFPCPDPQMTSAERHLIARLTVKAELIWQPFRWNPGQTNESARALAAILEKRAAYPVEGVELRIGGAATERQKAHRGLKKLETDGFVQVVRGEVHRVGVRLLRLDAMLYMTPNATLAECWPSLALVAAAADDPASSRQGDFVSESAILGADFTADDAELFADHAWPLCALGYLDSYTDSEGRLAWSITPAGRQALADGAPTPDDMSGEYRKDAADLYIQLSTAGFAERPTWRPRSLCNIAIPLGAGSWRGGNGD